MFTMDDMLAIVKPHNDKIVAEHRLQEAVAALTDIAKGNVPPGFLRGIENESKASFQERLAAWMQSRAHAALATINPPPPATSNTESRP